MLLSAEETFLGHVSIHPGCPRSTPVDGKEMTLVICSSGQPRSGETRQSGSGSGASPIHRLAHGKREERAGEAHPRITGTSQGEQQENGDAQEEPPSGEEENRADARGGKGRCVTARYPGLLLGLYILGYLLDTS